MMWNSEWNTQLADLVQRYNERFYPSSVIFEILNKIDSMTLKLVWDQDGETYTVCGSPVPSVLSRLRALPETADPGDIFQAVAGSQLLVAGMVPPRQTEEQKLQNRITGVEYEQMYFRDRFAKLKDRVEALEKPKSDELCYTKKSDVPASPVEFKELTDGEDMLYGRIVDLQNRVEAHENRTEFNELEMIIYRKVCGVKNDLQERIGKVERNVFLLSVSVFLLAMWVVFGGGK